MIVDFILAVIHFINPKNYVEKLGRRWNINFMNELALIVLFGTPWWPINIIVCLSNVFILMPITSEWAIYNSRL